MPTAPKSRPIPSAMASKLIDQRIADLGGWRGETLARMRSLILEADPEMVEEVKWGTPVWSHGGIVTTGEAYKNVVKLTFMNGAKIEDPSGIFNSSMDGNMRRAIDIKEGETLDARAFKALIKAAVAFNTATKAKPKAPAKTKAKPKAKPAAAKKRTKAPTKSR